MRISKRVLRGAGKIIGGLVMGLLFMYIFLRSSPLGKFET